MTTIYLTANTGTFNGITQAGNTIIATGLKDAGMNAAYPTYNYGTCPSVGWAPTGGSWKSRSIFYFPIAENVPAGSTIDSVELWFCGNGEYNIGNNDLALYRITDAHTFVEGAGACGDNTNNVSWNNYDTGSAWTTAGAAYNATQLGTWDIDSYYNSWGQVAEVSNGIKTYVQNIVSGTATDYGLLGISTLTSSTAGADSCFAKEGTDNYRPYLKIVYTAVSSVTADPADLDHGHSVDAGTLVQTHLLSPTESLLAHSAEQAVAGEMPLLIQHSFRFVNDDGDEDASSFAGDLNADIGLAPDDVFRLRFLINGAGDPASSQLQLEYRHKPSGGEFGAWSKVT